jgi:exonuclease III
LITILFWNVGGNFKALAHLPCLARASAIDVFLLAECPDDLTPTINSLNGLDGTYHESVASPAKVRAVTRLAAEAFVHRFTSVGREMAVWSLSAPNLAPPEVLIAGIHLPSKVGGSADADQASIAAEVVEELNEFEDSRRHRNTALVGDFNMHPYDPGMTSVTGVHAQMTRALARKRDRMHRRRPRRRFYNPMWGLFGDRTPGPAASYYWRAAVLHNPYWGMLDQLVLRASLIDYLQDVRVLDDDGVHPLTGRDGAPDRRDLSDHLPVLFQLDLLRSEP